MAEYPRIVCDVRSLSHDNVKWFIRNVPQLNKFWVWSYEFLGYGKQSDASKYWDIPYRKS